MDPQIAEFDDAIRLIDARLKPIANRQVDISDPTWVARLASSDPLVRADVRRDEAERLLFAIIGCYAACSNDEREAIREMFRRYPSFAWAVHLPQRPVTTETLRQELLLYSIQDQGQDSRDAILQLRYLIKQGVDAGVDVERITSEVAVLSSTVNRMGMGSTRDQLIGKT